MLIFMNPVYHVPSFYLELHWNIILIYIYMLRSFLRGHVVSCFPVKILFLFFFSSIRATFPAHLTLLVVITPVIFVEGEKLRSSSLCRRLHYPDSFSSRYLSQHYSRENPRPMLMWDIKFCMHVNNRRNYRYVCVAVLMLSIVSGQNE